MGHKFKLPRGQGSKVKVSQLGAMKRGNRKYIYFSAFRRL